MRKAARLINGQTRAAPGARLIPYPFPRLFNDKWVVLS
jgi:hypothetical protein